MINYNDYVAYRTLDSSDEVWDWLKFTDNNEKIYSNKTDYQNHAALLIEYKKGHLYNYKKSDNGHSYRNIYAHVINIMIPKKLTLNEKHEFAKKFAVNFDPRYKIIPYCYKFLTKGNGVYIEFLMFTRVTFCKGDKKLIKYNDTYYQDFNSKKRCTEDHPNAVLKHKKGTPILDKNGHKQYEKIYVQKKEAKIFKYRSFIKFIASIKKEVRYVTMMFTRNYRLIRKLSLIKVTASDNILTVQKKLIKNKMIIRINSELNFLQTAIYDGKFEDYETWGDRLTVKAFNKLLFKINQILYKANFKINKRSPEIYTGYKQSFVNFREANDILEDFIIKTYIKDFKQKYIYDYTLL
ncbi:MAG: hypothetical protein ACLRYM_06170 [Thomasclavelia ramosa]